MYNVYDYYTHIHNVNKIIHVLYMYMHVKSFHLLGIKVIITECIVVLFKHIVV